jgi:hypothetical protein
MKKGKASKQMCHYICSLRVLRLVLKSNYNVRMDKVPSSKVHSKKECSRVEKLPVKLSWPCFT